MCQWHIAFAAESEYIMRLLRYFAVDRAIASHLQTVSLYDFFIPNFCYMCLFFGIIPQDVIDGIGKGILIRYLVGLATDGFPELDVPVAVADHV